MPNIDNILPVYYEALNPYYVHYDNLPLRNIVARQQLINSAVENQKQILAESVGSAGTLANRLAQSLEDSGDLKSEAIDEAWHNIAYHLDGEYDDGVSIIQYVRMKNEERAKLDLIADAATSFALQVETPSTIVLFEDETIELLASSSVTWNVVAPNQIQAQLTFPSLSLHQHYYDQIPVNDDLVTPDYTNYKVNTEATAFIEGSLRIYINGIKLSAYTAEAPYGVYVPSVDGPDGTWTLMYFTPDYENGTFALNTAITEYDVIRIDYDRELD